MLSHLAPGVALLQRSHPSLRNARSTPAGDCTTNLEGAGIEVQTSTFKLQIAKIKLQITKITNMVDRGQNAVRAVRLVALADDANLRDPRSNYKTKQQNNKLNLLIIFGDVGGATVVAANIALFVDIY